MTEKPTRTVCSECRFQPPQETEYCGDCGAEDPWEEEYVYDWDRDVDLPVIIEEEKYDDTYELWRSFVAQAFGQYELNENEIANVPGTLPQMKYSVVPVYWKLTENLELKGPFLDKQEARDA